jgi:predicted Zn-dependent protease
MADRLAQLDKGGWYFLQLKGWVQREAGKLDDAIATYKEVITRIDESMTLKEDQKTRMAKEVRYRLTGLYVDGKKIDEAAEILQKLIKEDPDNPTFYNDLGFIWADHDKNLEESEGMIRKALELDAKQRQKLLAEKKDLSPDAIAVLKKENAAYLDSLGWVLFKNKKFAEAETYLRKATEDDDDGKHIEIWDHLADALVAQGKKQEAVEIWQKSLKFEDVSPRDAERRKKVTQKLNKVRAELKEKK